MGLPCTKNIRAIENYRAGGGGEGGRENKNERQVDRLISLSLRLLRLSYVRCRASSSRVADFSNRFH